MSMASITRGTILALVLGLCACGGSPAAPSGPATLTMSSLSAAVSSSGGGHLYEVQCGVSNTGGLTATLGLTSITFLANNAPAGNAQVTGAFAVATVAPGHSEQSNLFSVRTDATVPAAQQLMVQVAFTDPSGNTGTAARTITLP